MIINNKKAVSTTLTAFQNSQTQSHHNMTLSNKKVPCLEPSIITNRLVLLLAGGYSESTILNHVVRFGDLLYTTRCNSTHKDMRAFFMPAFYGGVAWEHSCVAGTLVDQFANLCNATALYCLATYSGSLLKLQGDSTMSNQVKTTTPKQGTANKRPFIRQFFYKQRIKRAIHALNSNKPLIDRWRAYNKNSINA